MKIVVSQKKILVRLEHQQQIFTLISLCFELSSSSLISGYYQFSVVVRDVLPLPFLGLFNFTVPTFKHCNIADAAYFISSRLILFAFWITSEQLVQPNSQRRLQYIHTDIGIFRFI